MCYVKNYELLFSIDGGSSFTSVGFYTPPNNNSDEGSGTAALAGVPVTSRLSMRFVPVVLDAPSKRMRKITLGWFSSAVKRARLKLCKAKDAGGV